MVQLPVVAGYVFDRLETTPFVDASGGEKNLPSWTAADALLLLQMKKLPL